MSGMSQYNDVQKDYGFSNYGYTPDTPGPPQYDKAGMPPVGDPVGTMPSAPPPMGPAPPYPGLCVVLYG